MEDFFSVKTFAPFESFGFTSPFLEINTETVIYTWIVMGILIGLGVVFQFALRKKYELLTFGFLAYVKMFKDLCVQTVGKYSLLFCSFILTIFTFVMFSNISSLIPYIEEPTSDLNTTLALSLTSFLFVQACSIRNKGVKGYIAEFFKPFFIMAPLNIISELASIMSMAMRLYGNIFGELMIARLWYQGALAGRWLVEILGLVFGINLLISVVLGVFTGVIQAFVFTILSLTYLALAVHAEHEGAAE